MKDEHLNPFSVATKQLEKEQGQDAQQKNRKQELANRSCLTEDITLRLVGWALWAAELTIKGRGRLLFSEAKSPRPKEDGCPWIVGTAYKSEFTRRGGAYSAPDRSGPPSAPQCLRRNFPGRRGRRHRRARPNFNSLKFLLLTHYMGLKDHWASQYLGPCLISSSRGISC